jgi:hypothetical protein
MTIDIAHRDIIKTATPAASSTLQAAEALGSNHADAEIIATASEFETLELSFPAIYAACEAAENAHPGPDAPEAIFMRRGDPKSLGAKERHDKRWWYYGAIDRLRTRPMARRARTDDGEIIDVPDLAAQKRADEIVAAFDRWQAACERDKIATGRAEVEASCRRAVTKFHELHAALVAARPATLAGVKAKAQACLVRRECIEEGEDTDNDRKLVISIAEDVIRLS